MQISTKCSIALHCLIFISKYETKMKVTSNLLAKSTGTNAVIIRNILNALQKAGMISIARGVGGAHMERKENEITMWDVYSALEPRRLEDLIGIHPNPSAICPIGRRIGITLRKPYLQIENAVKNEMQKITLSQLLDSYHTSEDSRETE